MRQAVDGKGTLLSLQSQIRDQSQRMDLLRAQNEQTSNGLPSLDTLRALEREWRPLGQAADSAQTLELEVT